MDLRPFSTCRSTCGGGKFSTISCVLILSVRKGARRASTALSSIFSGLSCSSSHLSRPMVRTRSTSPGRMPKVKRFKACTMRLSSSMGTAGLMGTAGFIDTAGFIGTAVCALSICVDASASELVGFDFLSLSLATSAAEITTSRPSRMNTLRVTGIETPEVGIRGYQPTIRHKVLPESQIKASELRQSDPPAVDAPVQLGDMVIDVGRGDVARDTGIDEQFPRFLVTRGPGTRWRHQTYGITTELDQERVDHVAVQLGRRQPADLCRSFTQSEPLAIRTVTQHSVKRIRYGHDPYRQRDFIVVQMVRISRSIGPLMMRTHHLRDLGPGELHGGNNRVAGQGMVGHLLKFCRLQRTHFGEEMLIHGDLADVMQISSSAHFTDFGGVHAQRFAHARRVASNAQRMTVHLHVLHINGGGESGQRVVPERMHRGQQLQVLRRALFQRHQELVVVNGQRDKRRQVSYLLENLG